MNGALDLEQACAWDVCPMVTRLGLIYINYQFLKNQLKCISVIVKISHNTKQEAANLYTKTSKITAIFV